MAGRIRDEDIALVRERSAVEEVVGEYLQLRSAGGGSLKGLCPFHDEKTPSFNVTPARGLWYCFSCTEGGDVIKFVQRIDNLSFAEAVERLAARAGIELRYEQGGHVPGREHSQRRRLIEAHRAAADFYLERIAAPQAGAARAFLSSRGFEEADWARFGVGYAPAEWDALTRHLRGRGFTDDELLRGGLARQGRRGPVDMFRNRLIWPIRDLTGDVIAFGARKLAEDDDGPKYLNTPETPLFKKSAVLYGADLAKRDIAQRRQAVIVEGYTDVMACHLAGITTAVATSGTSFGDGHIKILRRLLMDSDKFRGEVIFTFDGDAAGQRAVERAFNFEDDFVTQTMFARAARRPRPVRPAAQARRRRGPGPDRPARPVVRVRHPQRAAPSTTSTPTRGASRRWTPPRRSSASIKDYGLRDRYAVSLDRWLGMMDEDFVLARVRARAPSTPAQRRAGRTGAAGPNARPRQNGAVNGGPAEGGRDAGGGRGAAEVRYDTNDPVIQTRARGAEARGAAARAVRARLRRARGRDVHRPRARGGVRHHRRVRRRGHGVRRQGVGRAAARSRAR